MSNSCFHQYTILKTAFPYIDDNVSNTIPVKTFVFIKPLPHVLPSSANGFAAITSSVDWPEETNFAIVALTSSSINT